jgi:hypothetical protein
VRPVTTHLRQTLRDNPHTPRPVRLLKTPVSPALNSCASSHFLMRRTTSFFALHPPTENHNSSRPSALLQFRLWTYPTATNFRRTTVHHTTPTPDACSKFSHSPIGGMSSIGWLKMKSSTVSKGYIRVPYSHFRQIFEVRRPQII